MKTLYLFYIHSAKQNNLDPINMKSIRKPLFVFGLTIFLSIFLRIFIGEPCYIGSSSMEPTILVGDWLWINKYSYGSVMPSRWSDIPLINIFTVNPTLRKKDLETDWGYHRFKRWQEPKVHDIIVFKNPEDKKVLLVKRIVERLPKGTVLTIDKSNYQRYKSILLQENRRLETYFNSLSINNQYNYQLKNTYHFVLGDNQAISRDSRVFGYIAERDIIGQVNGVLFSTRELGRFLQKFE